jgi:hypothetical protein
MDKPTFWRLIEESKQQSHGEIKKQARSLLLLLSALPSDEIKAFDALFEEYYDIAYMSARLYDALEKVFIYVTHEDLMGFVEWLIGQGEALYKGVLRHPTHVGDIFVGNALAAYNGHILQREISEAYWRVTGRSLDREKLEVEDARLEERSRKREEDMESDTHMW